MRDHRHWRGLVETNMDVSVRCTKVGGRVERHLILKFEFLLLAQNRHFHRRKECPLMTHIDLPPFHI